ncbi:MAG: type 1 glutamine amidotransferase [Spirochaetes bacterium]|nr:MAG: type 1 glutamine amidotransferase [Spirochaetota bacterium]
MKFLIIDAYPEKSRAALNDAGMSYAWELYAGMVKRVLPAAEYTVFHPSDVGAEFPGKHNLEQYDGVLWTGADLTIFHTHVPSIKAQIDLAENVFDVGVPSYGSCWGIQMAAAAAGGEVLANTKGREMGIGRKILLTEEGRNHPMMKGKPFVFDAFESHYDIVVKPPEGTVVLAENEFSGIQAMSVTHKKGTFWSVQYHPEYNLHEMSRLTVVREKVLIEGGFFENPEDLEKHVERWELLHSHPDRSDLKWQLGIDEDILNIEIRQQEFSNWVNALVIPYSKEKEQR